MVGCNMKKMSYFFIFFLILCLSGCKSDEDYFTEPEDDDSINVILADDIPNRKIIYEVNMSLNVPNLSEAMDDLTSRLQADEWFDKESISENSAYYIIRIKTDRLDTFINRLKDDYALNNYEKNGTDISLQYQDKSSRILAIESQITRLNDLYANASLSDMIIINEQLSELEVELQKLNGELLVFDSLVDYSEVHLTMYGSRIRTTSPFFNRLGHSLETGFTALVSFFDGLIMVIATVLPFGIVLGGIGLGSVYLIKRHNKKLDLKKQNNQNNDSQK